jgi:AraC family transcriptional activator of pyochelin receptor
MVEKPASRMLVTPADAEEFATQLGTLFGPLEGDVSEVSILAEGPLCSGRAEVHSVRPGLRLFVMNMDVRQDVHLNIQPVSSGILMSLVLDGRSGYTVQGPAGRHDQWQFLPGRNIIGTFKTEESHWNVAGGDSHRLVELQVASGRALQLLSEYRKSPQGAVLPVLAKQDGFATHLHQGLSSELRIIGHQVLNCALEGSLRRLFMESKALEILTFQLDALSSSKRREPAGRSRDERNRLEEARRIIEREFVDPPSLMTLARRVGLNDFKLKRGFRELYRTTVFGYVRTLRMEKAWMMLETGELNVSEVALAIGYTCFGHFAEAFRNRFGVTPRDFKNRRRS